MQLHSTGEGSPQSRGDDHDAFLRRGRGASHDMRDAQSTARPVDTPRLWTSICYLARAAR
ncbi:hypothetical protein BJV78DRAFT_1243062 [Lactifluus subvellereus]|nr:hypothetical protein BJV78DRAFT_1243062 [Lactifluus subvellereus]